MASFNAHLEADTDLICAIRDNDNLGTAIALQMGAGNLDPDARCVLICCLAGTDHATEIVTRRRRGQSQIPKHPFTVPPAWHSTGLPETYRSALVIGLCDGSFAIKSKSQKGRRGKRSVIFTKEIRTGVLVEERAFRWAHRVHGLKIHELRTGAAEMPRGGWRAAIAISATLSVGGDDIAPRENRNNFLDTYRKALRAWHLLKNGARANAELEPLIAQAPA